MSEKEALRIHGYVFSSDSEDSHCNDSSSSSDSEFDAKYSALKPPPLSAEVLKSRSVRVTKAPEAGIKQNKTQLSNGPNFHNYCNNGTNKNVPNKPFNLRDNHNVEQVFTQSNQNSRRRRRYGNKRANRNRNNNSQAKQQNTENFTCTKYEPKQQVLPKEENNAVPVVNNQNNFPYNTRCKALEWKLNIEPLENRQTKDSARPSYLTDTLQKNESEKQRETFGISDIHNISTRKNSVISISLQNTTSSTSKIEKSDSYEEQKPKTCKSHVGHVTYILHNEFRDTPQQAQNVNACNEIVDTVLHFKDDANIQIETIGVVDIHNAPTRRNSKLSMSPQIDASTTSKSIKMNEYEEIKSKIHEICASHNVSSIQKEFKDSTSPCKYEEKYHLQNSDNKYDESNTVNNENDDILISNVPKVIKSNQVQPIMEENQTIESSHVVTDMYHLKEKDNLEDVYWWDVCCIIRKCLQCQAGENAT